MTDFRERQYVSQFAADVLGLAVHKAGVPSDVDDNAVNATLIQDAIESNSAVIPDTPPTTIFTRAATRVAVGLYEVPLDSSDTSVPGDYTVQWQYTIDGNPEQYLSFIQIGASNPAYDNLPPEMKTVVDDVWIRFADLFDSPLGGPNLQTYFQSHFSRGRVAQLLKVAVGLLNTTAQPFQTYSIDMPGQFPVAQWGSLLEQALYVEVLKHLVRSYVEQPMFMGGNVTRLDRRDYMDRWKMVLDDERQTLKGQLDIFKISNMGLGKPRVLVSGGVYGRYGPTRFAGSVAARPRYWTRFYVALLIASGAVLSAGWHASASQQPTSPPTSGRTSISQGA